MYLKATHSLCHQVGFRGIFLTSSGGSKWKEACRPRGYAIALKYDYDISCQISLLLGCTMKGFDDFCYRSHFIGEEIESQRNFVLAEDPTVKWGPLNSSNGT